MDERKDILTLSNGELSLTWPVELSKADLEDIQQWLTMRLNAFSRDSIRKQKTHFQRISRFFNDCGNEWAFLSEIQEMVCINNAAIRQVIYNTKKQEFVRQADPEGSKKSQFRLRVFND
ncbi:hypothetical protein LCGC14_0248570 [marine sediment metagenome]|uniref:Uncharacterized protein n=1 Tax=marine sediment metagenome TaxID=412755 RepID=A0A0F9U510_9ZZZZ